MKINIGCGKKKLDGFVNIDIDDSVNPDIVCNVGNEMLIFDDDFIMRRDTVISIINEFFGVRIE